MQAVEAPLRGLRRAEHDFGITARFIIAGLRQSPPENSLELARLAVEFKDDGVVAFDLAGGEKGNPASRHAEAFRYAREHNLAVTVHAGEGDGPESVRQAVHVCGANRIGHGTRLIEDPELTDYVNDRRIALEVCLTSNVQTRVADSYETHPLREYFDRGLNVTLSSNSSDLSGYTSSGDRPMSPGSLFRSRTFLKCPCRTWTSSHSSVPFAIRTSSMNTIPVRTAPLVAP